MNAFATQKLVVATAALLVLVCVTLGARAIAQYRAAATFESRVAAVQQTGEPTSLTDLKHKPVPPSKNAVNYLHEARAGIDGINWEVDAAFDLESEHDQQAFYDGRPTTPLLSAIRDALAAYPQTIGLLTQAAQAPYYHPLFNFSGDSQQFMADIWKETKLNRAALRVLSYQAALQTADGQTDDALRTCLIMLRLCKRLDGMPTTIGSLVALAARGVTYGNIDHVLRSGPVDEGLRDSLETELAADNLVVQYRRGLASDRALGIKFFREAAAGNPHLEYDPQTWGHKSASFWAADFAGREDAYFDYMAALIALADKTYAEVVEDPLMRRTRDDRGPVGKQISPAGQATQMALARSLTFNRCLRILNAIGRVKEPTEALRLTDLNLPAQAQRDPFNGQSLNLKKLADGWLVYSVGHNFRDDGGEIVELEDCGLGPFSSSSTGRSKE